MTRLNSIDNQFPHLGLAAYFTRPLWRDAEQLERVARLLVDVRWPWIPWWASFSGVTKRDKRSATRVGGKNGSAPLISGMQSPRLTTLYMRRARGDGNFTSATLDLGRRHEEEWGWEAPLRLLLTCRCAELPVGTSIKEWLTLAHDLVSEVGALHATLGVWPTYDMAIGDTWLAQLTLDTPRGDYNLGLPTDYNEQLDLLARWKKFLGRTYARHPRWGTYLNAEHVAAIGGVDRIRAEVQPARIDAVGDLTYIQLTETVETALTAEGNDRRLRLQELMAPILLGAPRPGSPAAPAG